MKILTLLIATILLASCGGPAFKYNKNTACEINYGMNGFSVIIDGDKRFIKNNRQLGFGNMVIAGTADRTYSTIGRYFHEADTDDFIESLKRSRKIYMRWQDVGDRMSSGDIFTNIIYVSDFSERFESCINSQRTRS